MKFKTALSVVATDEATGFEMVVNVAVTSNAGVGVTGQHAQLLIEEQFNSHQKELPTKESEPTKKDDKE